MLLIYVLIGVVIQVVITVVNVRELGGLVWFEDWTAMTYLIFYVMATVNILLWPGSLILGIVEYILRRTRKV